MHALVSLIYEQHFVRAFANYEDARQYGKDYFAEHVKVVHSHAKNVPVDLAAMSLDDFWDNVVDYLDSSEWFEIIDLEFDGMTPPTGWTPSTIPGNPQESTQDSAPKDE